MNPREKILSAAIATLALGFAANHWVLEPALAWYQAAQTETQANQEKITAAQDLISHRKTILTDWRARHAAGLLDDEKSARFGAQKTLNAAARGSGFKIESLGGGQRVPATTGQAYDLLRLTLSGRGSLAQTQGFLAAIQQASLPWRVERYEVAARDGRKDQLDGALTLSLRIASMEAREKISVPPKTTAWAPAKRPGTLDADILKAKPFLTDRQAAEPVRAAVKAPTETTPIAAPPPPTAGTGWVLAGLVTRNGVGEAVVVRTADGSVHIVHGGDTIADGVVKQIDADGLRMTYGSEERLIQPGLALTGKEPAAADAAPSTRTPGSSSAVPAIGPSATPKPAPTASDADREAILNRLRQQRNRTSN